MTLNKPTFNALNNQEFTIQFNAKNTLTAQLIEIKSINSHVVKEGQPEPFSLVFEIKENYVFEQNTFIIYNKEIGKFSLFLVPIGADENGVRYEAIFT